MAVYDEGFAPHAHGSRAGSFVNYAGAALSLALIAGVSFWGYKLIVRDVSGIPVVRAMEGEMRVLPDNPGGAVALHTGLAVNEVAAVGEAGGPEDRLVLAPATSGLAQEDLDVPVVTVDDITTEALTELTLPQEPQLNATETGLVQTTEPDEPSDADILAMADQIAAGVETFEAVPGPEVISASVPGPALSPRPSLRPSGLQTQIAAPSANTSEVAVTTTVFPAGTNLVQLGAFPDPTLAASEWSRLQGRFSQLMGGKDRVIQVSNQTSGTWYRLRASGFADRNEARRFCTALEAEGANCIAVLVN